MQKYWAPVQRACGLSKKYGLIVGGVCVFSGLEAWIVRTPLYSYVLLPFVRTTQKVSHIKAGAGIVVANRRRDETQRTRWVQVQFV